MIAEGLKLGWECIDQVPCKSMFCDEEEQSCQAYSHLVVSEEASFQHCWLLWDVSLQAG